MTSWLTRSYPLSDCRLRLSPRISAPRGKLQHNTTILRRWRNDGPAQLRLLFQLGAAAIGVIVPVSAIFVALALTSDADSELRWRRMRLRAVRFCLGWSSPSSCSHLMTTVGLPKLRIQLACEFSKPNNPLFEADRLDDNVIRARKSEQLSSRIAIWNDGPYPAREPRVIVRLNGMAFTAGSESRHLDGWSPLDIVGAIGITAIEWEGGLGYSIHPHSVRRLPGFHLSDLRWKEEWGEPGFIIEILLGQHPPSLLPASRLRGRRRELLAMEETDRGTAASWMPPPPEKRRREPRGSEVYTQLPDHAQERQAPVPSQAARTSRPEGPGAAQHARRAGH